jgi:hypothetical protein
MGLNLIQKTLLLSFIEILGARDVADIELDIIGPGLVRS